MRRYYFLTAIIFSLSYPIFHVDALGSLIDFSSKTEEMQTSVFIGDLTMDYVIVEDAEEAKTPIEWTIVGKNILMAGILFFSLLFMWRLFSIVRIKSRSEKRTLFGYLIHHLKDDITPFSFFNWIFIHTETHTEKELKQILLHEQTHVREWHSLDILLVETLRILFWWNPIVWLMKRDIAINLEYLADNAVLQNGVETSEYQYHLLQLTYQDTAVQIVNNFNVSQLKKRIIMMNKNKSPMRKLAKYLSVLPLALLLIMANSVYAGANETQEPVKEIAPPPPPPPPPPVKKGTFIVVDEYPEFPGGTRGLMNWLGENIQYPKEAQEKRIEGRVIMNFTIEKDGSVSDVIVKSGQHPLLDAEALRVVPLMPNWKPGEINKEIVRVMYTLPLVFRLPSVDQEKVRKSGVEADEVLIVVDKQPEYPGGMTPLMEFLGENIKYPIEAQKNKIEGRVIVNFVVNKDGSLSDIMIVRGQDPLLDAEAIRVISIMPKWKPGTQKGEAVNVRFTLPVDFRLKSNKEEAPFSLKEEGPIIGFAKSKENSGELLYFLSGKIKYPAIAQENGIMGFVKASYDVNINGEVSNIKIVEGADPSLEAELTRIIKTMPKDIALIKTDGKAASNNNLSANFILQGDERKVLESEKRESDITVVGYWKATNKLKEKGPVVVYDIKDDEKVK